ncbi:hypothetical protein DOTSEDRAFT_124412 [Dothistroma septosporum NZE10]|uniref:Major facilitator superfamily (MFS) profile domain-containing protein n=1 Tax=Dothistroma septosporum (strain NZE10 / CBS 128990) TaxID=675120 RepID=N1PUN9_DOTSN|nr:hypothetical protein DOTSEDRAFT_124412 [Dothistroma septosporum NZE10]
MDGKGCQEASHYSTGDPGHDRHTEAHKLDHIAHQDSTRQDSILDDNPSTSPPRDIHGIKWTLVVISLISVTFLWGLDGTITADMQVTFVRQFHSIDKLAYNSTAFFLGAAATVLTWGQIYGQLNAKYVFITCIIIFEAGSALCGAAPNIDALIAGRCICGVGGSGMYVGVLTLLSMTTSEKERALYMGFPGITWGIGTVSGPIIGGAFAQGSATWRWGFYINLCVGALFAPVYLLLVPSKDARPGASWRDRLANIDYVGLVLLAGSTTCVILAICFGGLTFPWDSGSMIALWTVGGVLFILFAIQQAKGSFARQVVFPVAMMKRPNVLIIFFNETCSATACFLPCYFIPLFFQYIRDESALLAGVHLLPFICFMVSTVMVCGTVVSKTGRWLPWFFYGGALVLTGGALMYTVSPTTSTAKIYGYTILIGSGTGAYIQMPFNACQECVDPALIPAAVGLITWAQLAAPAITLSIANAVFLNTAKNKLATILPPDAPALSIVSGVGKDYLQRLKQETREEVVGAIVHSLGKSYVLVITSGALTLVLSVFLLNRIGGRTKH